MNKLIAHPKFSDFFDALKANPGCFSVWAGVGFKTALPRYACPPYVLTGAGALLAGGRWNTQGLMPAVYLSADAQTVAAEADQQNHRNHWQLPGLLPQTRVVFNLRLQKVLDVTAPDSLQLLHVGVGKLTGCDWRAEQQAGNESLTQAIGRAAFENMAEGILVPSAQRSGGRNLVLFPGNRQVGSIVELLHPGEVPLVHGL